MERKWDKGRNKVKRWKNAWGKGWNLQNERKVEMKGENKERHNKRIGEGGNGKRGMYWRKGKKGKHKKVLYIRKNNIYQGEN